MKKISQTQTVSIAMILCLAAIMVIAFFAASGYSNASTLSLNVNTVNDSVYTTININGQLIVDSLAKQGASIGVTVDDKDGNHIYADELTTNITGHYNTYFKLDNTATGRYKIYASSLSAQGADIVSTQFFSVGECTENWQYSSWSSCGSNYLQTRTAADLNNCGTTEGRSSLSRECVPTCQTLGGEICSSSQSCTGSYIDASDTFRCCDGMCRTGTPSSGTASNNNNNNVNSQQTETENTPHTDDDEPETDAGQTPSDTTGDSNETASADNSSNPENSIIQMNQTETGMGAPENVNDKTPTGGFVSFVSNNRWAIINIILILMVALTATKLIAKKGPATQQKYSFKPKRAKTGLLRSLLNLSSIFQSIEFGYRRNQIYTGYSNRRPVKILKVVVESDE